jgi:hypothetical protein
MSAAADRLDRLRRRGETLFRDMTRMHGDHKRLMEHAWAEALAVEMPDAAVKASRLDSILCLFERITRPSRWLDEQATWFNGALFCLLDAVRHAGGDVPPPILVIEPIDSPLYVPRARVPGMWLPQATPADLPLPVVLCPGNSLEEPWAWATLFHELGHHLDAARKDTPSLLVTLDEEEARVDLGSWTSEKWVGEVIADLYAGLLGGPGAVETLKASLGAKSYSSSHPSDEARIAVLTAAWSSLRGGEPPRGDAPTDIVARALAQRFEAWRPRIASDCELGEDRLDEARLVPGALRSQYTAGVEPAALREACKDALAPERRGEPPWALTEAHLATLAGAMRNLVETRVQPGTESLKVPPVELLVRHDRMSFVGATHGQLLAKLREAAKHRRAPWAHIELFALADAPLKELILGDKRGEALIAERDEALRAIGEYLAAEQIPHRMYIYGQPYLFASFWDAEENARRPAGAPPAHVHVSNALWETDLRHTMGTDLEAPAGEPLPRTMAHLVEALSRLRRTSRALA